jgi:hypothetical protein
MYYVPEYFVYRLPFFLTTMGEAAKKKRAAEARAAKKAKAAQLEEAPASASTDPTSSDIVARSNTSNSKKTGKVPRVPSDVQSVSTRQSTRLALVSSSTLGSGKKNTSPNLEGNDNGKSRQKRSATAAALALLQELQVSDTEEAEHDPEGVFSTDNEVEDEDGRMDGSDEGSDGSDIVVIEEPRAVAQKGLPKVPPVRKKPNLQAINEEDSESSDESGEYSY